MVVICFTGCLGYEYVKGESVRGDILLLTGVLLLILCSESAFCAGSLNAGYNSNGNGTITIGTTAPDFTVSSGTITLNGDAEIRSSNNHIKLGNYTEENGAAIFAAGRTISSVRLYNSDLALSAAGTLTIYGGVDATAEGVVNITGAISTDSAGIKILTTGDATSGAISVDGAIDSSFFGGGGDVTVSTTGGEIRVGNINSSSDMGGAGGAVTVSTTGSGAITVYGAINSSSSMRGAGGAVTVSTTGSGAITVYGEINSSSDMGGAGGDVTVSTDGGAITVGHIYTYASSGTGGAVKVLAANGKIKSLGNIQTNNGTVTI